MASQQPENHDKPAGTGTNYLLLIIQAWAFSAEVFLHRGFGERYIGVQGGLVLLLAPFYAALWEGRDLRALVLFIPVYLLMCVAARLGVVARRRRGEFGHSYYSGWPRLMRFFPGHDEVKFKLNTEPILVVLFGCAVCLVDLPLGVYLSIAGFCIGLKTTEEIAGEHHLDLDMNDVVIDQEQRAERFRAMRRNRR